MTATNDGRQTGSQLVVYHRVPPELRGTILHPLSQLRAVFPDLAARALQKYAGREVGRKTTVPRLNCRPDDVLNLSPVDPAHLRDGLIAAGHEWRPRRWFVIPFARLDLAKTVLKVRKPWNVGDPGSPDVEYLPCDAQELAHHAQPAAAITTFTRWAWRSDKERGVSPLLFVGVAHVLYNGWVNVADATVLEI